MSTEPSLVVFVVIPSVKEPWQTSYNDLDPGVKEILQSQCIELAEAVRAKTLLEQSESFPQKYVTDLIFLGNKSYESIIRHYASKMPHLSGIFIAFVHPCEMKPPKTDQCVFIHKFKQLCTPFKMRDQKTTSIDEVEKTIKSMKIF